MYSLYLLSFAAHFTLYSASSTEIAEMPEKDAAMIMIMTTMTIVTKIAAM